MALIDEYRQQPVWATAESLRTITGEKSAGAQEDRERLKRAGVLARYVLRQQSVDPFLLPSNWRDALANVNSNLAETYRLIEGWDATQAMSVATNQSLDGYHDSTLSTLRPWPWVGGVAATRAVTEIAQQYQSSSEADLRSLREEIATLRRTLDTKSTEIASLTTDVTTMTTAAKTSAEAIRTEVTSEIAAARKAIEDTATTGVQAFEAKVRDLDEQTAALVGEIDTRAAQAKDLISKIGGAGISDGYYKYANTQRRAAFLWSLAAVLLGVGAVAFLGATLWDVSRVADPSPSMIVLKSAVSVTGLAVAGYMTRIAAHHRQQAVKARFRALDMMALEPFTTRMDPDERKKLLAAVGTRVFTEEPDTQSARAVLSRPSLPPK